MMVVGGDSGGTRLNDVRFENATILYSILHQSKEEGNYSWCEYLCAQYQSIRFLALDRPGAQWEKVSGRDYDFHLLLLSS